MAGIDMVKLREKLMEVQSGIRSQGGKYFTPPYGETRVRILPGPAECPEDFFVQYHVIRINNQTMVSPKSVGQFCPIAKWVNDAYESGDENLIAKAKVIKPRKQFALNVIIRELKDNNGSVIATDVGPRVYSCGIKVFEKVCGWIADVENYPNFLDVKEGNDCKISKVRKDGFPNYDGSTAMAKPTPLHEDPKVVQEWLSNLHDLKAELKIASPDELQRELDNFLSGGNNAGYVAGAATTQTTAQPTTQPAAQPTTQAATQPAAQPATQPAATTDEAAPEASGDDQEFFEQLQNLTQQ